MLIGALMVPAVVGIVSIFVVEPAKRPKGPGIVRPGPSRLPAERGARRDACPPCPRRHRPLRPSPGAPLDRRPRPVVVRPGGYERVVADLERALDDAGPRGRPPAGPGRARGAGTDARIDRRARFRSLVPEKLVELAGAGLEVGLYPSDIAISGDKVRVARARAAIASRLVATAAWMTTSAEAQEIEDDWTAGRGADGRRRNRARGRERRETAPIDVPAELRSIDEALAVLAVPHEEWEVLYRERLQVERDLLAGSRPGASLPGRRAQDARAGPQRA